MQSLNSIFDHYYSFCQQEELSIPDVQRSFFKKKVLLFGAGSAGIGFLLALRNHGMDAECFLDNNPQKQGHTLEGLPIYSPAGYNQRENTMVILCINTDGKKMNNNWSQSQKQGGPQKIIDDLQALGYKEVIYYAHFWRCYPLFVGEGFPLPSCSDVLEILKNRELITKTYELLTDKKSKDIFLAYLSFRLISRDIEIPSDSFEKKYFGHSFRHITENECFVDGGAYNGNTLQSFLKASNNKFNRYYGFEPDRMLFAQLKQTCDQMGVDKQEKLHLFRSALYNQTTDLPLYELNGPGTLVHERGPSCVKGQSLDDIVWQAPPTFLKLNIEGCEMQALQGGAKLISECGPTISARLLKISDLWEAPLFLHNIRRSYQFYLRSYMGYLDFFLFAVDQKRY